MKKILKSLLMLSLIAGMTGASTKAWFTSEVTAADNEITTGTLLLAIDSSSDHTTVQGTNWYNVVEDINGVSTPSGTPFEAWTNAEPGIFASYTNVWPRQAGNFSIWMAVRNKGTLDLNYRAAAMGEWINGSRFGTPGCPATAADADATLVKVMNIHRYRYLTTEPFAGCESHIACQNLRNGLVAAGYTPKSGVTASDFAGPVTGYFDDNMSIGANEFVVYRVDLQLSETADNCYQGATYNYDLAAQAKQLLATW